MAELFHISFVTEAEDVTNILKLLSNRVANLQIHPVTDPTAKPSRQANGKANGKANARSGVGGIRPGSGSSLILKLLKRANGAPVSYAKIKKTFLRHGLSLNTHAIARLVKNGFAKRIDNGTYVYTGKDK